MNSHMRFLLLLLLLPFSSSRSARFWFQFNFVAWVFFSRYDEIEWAIIAETIIQDPKTRRGIPINWYDNCTMDDGNRNFFSMQILCAVVVCMILCFFLLLLLDFNYFCMFLSSALPIIISSDVLLNAFDFPTEKWQ